MSDSNRELAGPAQVECQYKLVRLLRSFQVAKHRRKGLDIASAYFEFATPAIAEDDGPSGASASTPYGHRYPGSSRGYQRTMLTPERVGNEGVRQGRLRTMIVRRSAREAEVEACSRQRC